MSKITGQQGRTARFNEQDMKKLERVDRRQKDIREDSKKKLKLTPEQLSAFDVHNEEEVNRFCQTAFSAKGHFDADREHGVSRISKETTGLAAIAYDLLRDFSPLIEVVRDFGAPFGNVAIGTLCCLFAVAKTRVSIEEDIQTTLKAIKDRLPGLAMYRNIYNEDHELDQSVQSCIVETYTSFMDYCIEAVEFYTLGRCHRLLETLLKRNNLSQKAEYVQQTVVNVRLVCEEALGRNVNTIKQKLEEVQVSNEALRAQIQELQDHDDMMTLGQVGTLLNVDGFSQKDHQKQLAMHRENVEVEFWPKTWHGEQERLRQINQITTDEVYKTWHESESSGLFVISGENEFSRAYNCWASRVALDLIDDQLARRESDPSSVCAFYLFGHRDHDDTYFHALPSLIYQVLRLNMDQLRGHAQLGELLAKLHQYQKVLGESSEEQEKQKALEDVASTALGMISGDKEIWIVLDRVDKCRNQVENLSQSWRRSLQGARAILASLSKVAVQGAANIKVLAVVNRTDWLVDLDDEDLRDMQENIIIKRYCQVSY